MPECKKGYATQSRKIIMDYIMDNSSHTVSAADIDKYLKSIGHEVNITTIYRYLDKLAKDGTVMKYISKNGDKAGYQYVELGNHCEAHLHLECVNCGEIIHLDCGFMDEINEHIEAEHGFKLECKNSILYGLCKKCRGESSKLDMKKICKTRPAR